MPRGLDLSTSWRNSAILLIALQISASFFLGRGFLLTAFSVLFAASMIVFTALAAATNAIRNTQSGRAFWGLVAASFFIWAVNLWIWIYWEVAHRESVPDRSIADPALFLHVVPLMAAIATRPDRPKQSHYSRRVTINLLILVFFWVFLYAYVLFPPEFLAWDSVRYNSGYNILYLIENLVVMAAFLFLARTSKPPWRTIYRHILGALALYTAASLAANVAIDRHDYYPGNYHDIAILISLCWMVWIALRARTLDRGAESSSAPHPRHATYSFLAAMSAVLAIPLIGLWELHQPSFPEKVHDFRILVVLISTTALAVLFIIKENLANRSLASLLIEKDRLVQELKDSAARVRVLNGLLPICASCKKIRDDVGTWHQLEVYIHRHSEAEFTHGLCPTCLQNYRAGMSTSGHSSSA